VATSKISHDNEKLGSFLLVAASRTVHTEDSAKNSHVSRSSEETMDSFSLMNDRHSTQSC